MTRCNNLRRRGVPFRAGAAAIAALVAYGCRAEPTRAADGFPASAWNQQHNSRLRLVAGPEIATGGVHYRTAGIEVTLAPGWKTYWRMPGDSGVPPSLDWAASDNVASLELLFPAPTRMLDQSGTAIGYKDTVTFPLRMTAKNPAKPATIVVEFAYGVCRDICIPAEAKLQLVLPAGLAAAQGSPALAAALERVPRRVGIGAKSDPASHWPRLATVAVVRAGAEHKIVIETDAADDVFVEAPDGTFIPLAERRSASPSARAVFEVDLAKAPDAKDLAGKRLLITVVGTAGAVDAEWLLP